MPRPSRLTAPRRPGGLVQALYCRRCGSLLTRGTGRHDQRACLNCTMPPIAPRGIQRLPEPVTPVHRNRMGSIPIYPRPERRTVSGEWRRAVLKALSTAGRWTAPRVWRATQAAVRGGVALVAVISREGWPWIRRLPRPALITIATAAIAAIVSGVVATFISI